MKSRSLRSKLRLSLFPPVKKKVAIVVPLSARPELTEGERTSLRHLYRFLSGYDIFFIVPPKNAPKLPEEASVIVFPSEYFGSALAHSRMQLSAEFYEQFIDYEYILMYHLDALAFSDQLEQWCDKGLDFIGAPWMKTAQTPWVQEPEVGNSGFALMHVRNFLRVLYSHKRMKTVSKELDHLNREGGKGLARLFSIVWALRRLTLIRNDVRFQIKQMLDRGELSDLFWSRVAKHYDKGFKVASVTQALEFSFEADPYRCYEMSGQRLPFGCHAWEKFDPEFWKPYLLTEDNSAVLLKPKSSLRSAV